MSWIKTRRDSLYKVLTDFYINIRKLNLILKLKLINLIFLNNFKKDYYFTFLNKKLFWDNIFYLYTFKYSNFYNSNLLKFKFNKKKYKIFNKYFYNQFYLSNILFLNYKFFHDKVSFYSNFSLKYLFFFIKFTKMSKKKKINQLSTFQKTSLFFFKFFILKYLNKYFKEKNLLLSVQKNRFKIKKTKKNRKILRLFFKRSKKLLFLKKIIRTHLKPLLKIILSTLQAKDVILIKNLIKYIIELTHIKQHKKILFNLRAIYKFSYNFFFQPLKVLGILIILRGKIGVGGNLKKRRFRIKYGKFSYSQKNQKMNYTKGSLRTSSGALGLEIYLSYK